MILPNQPLADIYEYAALIGAVDAAEQQPLSETWFTWTDNEVVKEARRCYELGYLMEQESNALWQDSEHSLRGFIRSWNDVTGHGIVEFVTQGQLKQIPFSYLNMQPEDADKSLDPGSLCTVTLKYDSDIKLLSVSPD